MYLYLYLNLYFSLYFHLDMYYFVFLIEQPVGPGDGVLGDLVAEEVYMYFMCGCVYVFVFVLSICILIFRCIILYI